MCLHASLDTILQRTAQARTRPLLNVENPEARIRQLYAERAETYKRAGTVILTDFRPLHDIVQHVLRAYRREARDWERTHGATPVGKTRIHSRQPRREPAGPAAEARHRAVKRPAP